MKVIGFQKIGVLLLTLFVLSVPCQAPPPAYDSCESYCIDQGYDWGVCRQTPGSCSENNEAWENNGNKFCNEGPGGGAGNCCCGPAESTTTMESTTTIPEIISPEFPSVAVPFILLAGIAGVMAVVRKA